MLPWITEMLKVWVEDITPFASTFFVVYFKDSLWTDPMWQVYSIFWEFLQQYFVWTNIKCFVQKKAYAECFLDLGTVDMVN